MESAHLSDELVERYQKLHQTEFGEEITFEQAREYGTRMVNYFKLLHDLDDRIKEREQISRRSPRGDS